MRRISGYGVLLACQTSKQASKLDEMFFCIIQMNILYVLGRWMSRVDHLSSNWFMIDTSLLSLSHTHWSKLNGHVIELDLFLFPSLREASKRPRYYPVWAWVRCWEEEEEEKRARWHTERKRAYVRMRVEMRRRRISRCVHLVEIISFVA